MPYNQLNLARITAVQNMNTGATCNLCLKVVNTANPAKFIYVLAVDLGGAGLDVSRSIVTIIGHFNLLNFVYS